MFHFEPWPELSPMVPTVREAGIVCPGREKNVNMLCCLYSNYVLKYLLSIDLFGQLILKVPILFLFLLFHCIIFLHKPFIHLFKYLFSKIFENWGCTVNKKINIPTFTQFIIHVVKAQKKICMY